LKWERPEHMAPTGEKSLSQIRQLMQEQRQHCLELLSRMESGEGTFHRIRLSVADIGKIDMYQWLYFLAQHARRHILQMERNEREWV
ncbi:DinB family protein, partial [Candidatus Saccharibacteria bacterium]|nr:DinB family protein [Candidatus Saccharibacteria bacterium]NIV03655.1 DinB family protein [Calditrichia bacterium]NIV71957.1 DinB family protein [Calditrichia bacterium]NIV98747.1 DinB family protein [Candidatus Saccharibacteria bacterium]NIW79013.1 DinB family protein [Calditrichia bacterium]